MVPVEVRLVDILVPVDAPVEPEELTPARVPEEDDLTACPALGLGALETEVMDDLEAPPVADDDLVAVLALVAAAPLLDLAMEELLTPADLAVEPMPLLVAEPVVETLGL